jgi:hypothetical protein
MAGGRRKRGSVLLLAIGLLTIIAILASTFLIVSNLDAQETEILVTKAQADPSAEGIVSLLQFWLGMDMYADDKGPFGAVADGNTGWAQFIDAVGDANARIDQFLSQPYDRLNTTKFYTRALWTKIFDETPLADVSADVDGDDANDAELYPIYPDANTEERESNFYRAVRVVDLSGKLCINTAGQVFLNGDGSWKTSDLSWPDEMSPCLIQQSKLLGDPVYQKVHRSRCKGLNNVPLRKYDEECGRKLLTPRNVYDPFGIGDEVFLLWCERLGARREEDPAVFSGRLAYKLADDQGLADELRLLNTDPNKERGNCIKRMLTTFSSTAAVVRKPDPDKGLVELEWLQDCRTNKQGVYNRMFQMLQRLGIGGTESEQKLMAAHFTANLEAYLSPGWEGFPWTFKPDGADFTVYGLKQDLVITEVFAKHFGPSDPNAEDGAWGWAIELMNPTHSNLSLTGYSLEVKGSAAVGIPSGSVGGVPEDLSQLASLTAPKAVLYRFEPQPKCKTSLQEFFGVTSVTGWVECKSVNWGENADQVVRLLRVSGSENVPMDEFSTAKMGGYVRSTDPNDPSAGTPASPVVASIRRDDRVQTAAGGSLPLTNYNLGYWTTAGQPGPGLDNGLTDDSTMEGLGKLGDAFGAGILEAERTPTDITRTKELLLDSVGDLCNIYLCGPVKDEGGFPQRVIRQEDSSIFRSSPARGRLPFCPNFPGGTENGVSYGGYNPGTYPDVPAGCMYGEFFTTVVRHHRPRERSRIYGLINVSTALRDVLLCLPWPTKVPRLGRREVEASPPAGEKYYLVSPETAVNYILQYRESGGRQANGGVAGLRSGSSGYAAFLTPGEVAIPLATYMDQVMMAGAPAQAQLAVKRHPDYLRTRNALYRAIAGCITTRSDTFAAYIQIRYRTGGRYKWNYLAVLDRSNVLQRKDTPAIILFTEVK